MVDFDEKKEFDKIYTENDIELLRFYLTLYPERLARSI